MARRTKLSDKGLSTLKPKLNAAGELVRVAYPDAALHGGYIFAQPSGAHVYKVTTRGPSKKQVWGTIGTLGPTLSLDEAREKGAALLKRLKAGEDPAGPQSFEVVANEWFEKRMSQLRSAKNIRWNLDKHILHVWRHRDFASIRRGDIVKLIDNIREGIGEASAETVYSIVRRIVLWYARRNEGYDIPIVPGMGEFRPSDRARERILEDDEIRAVWAAAERNGTYGAFIRLALLTAQRKDKVISMKWEDLIDGVWRIPSEAREKGNAGDLALPQMALDIIYAQPRLVSNPYVLSGQRGHWNSFSAAKEAFDRKVPISSVGPFTICAGRRAR